MHNAFMKGVQYFGLPPRVRTDQGKENIEVASACYVIAPVIALVC